MARALTVVAPSVAAISANEAITRLKALSQQNREAPQTPGAARLGSVS